MKTLIIYAHPQTKGHCSFALSEVKKSLAENKQEHEVIDLYKIKYDSVLHEDELFTANKHAASTLTKSLQNKITAAENLIFIYPNWWSGPPAILKGFFDKIFVPRFAYKFVNERPVKLLTGKKAAVIITQGSPEFVTKFIMQNRGTKVITQDTLGFCGIKSKSFIIDGCFEFNEKQEEKIKKKVKDAVKYLY